MGSGTCQDFSLDMPLVKLIQSCSDVVCNWPLCVLVLRLIERDPGEGQYQMLPVTAPGKSFFCCCYKEIHSLWLPLLCLAMFGKDQAAHQGQCPPAPNPREVTKRPKISQDWPLLASSCWLPIRVSHWKSLWQYSNCMRKFLSNSYLAPGRSKWCS